MCYPIALSEVKDFNYKELGIQLSQGTDAYFFLVLCSSTKDIAAKITSNRVSTSIKLIGQHPPYVLEGIPENHIHLTVQLYIAIITWQEQMFKRK